MEAAPGATRMAVISGGDRRTISTGSIEIDKKMAGGIPEGSLVLIEGQSSAGKSVVTQQFLNGALNGGFRCVLYTTENTASSLFRQMASLDLDVTDFFLLGAMNVYHAPAAMAPEMAENIFGEMLDHIASLEGRFDVVFIDSLTSFVSQVPEQATLTFLTQVKQYCDRNMTICFTIHSYALEESMFMRMRSLCDVYLRLRVEEVGDRLMKVLEVAKVRGADKNTGNIINFDIEPGVGMRIIPVSSARA